MESLKQVSLSDLRAEVARREKEEAGALLALRMTCKHEFDPPLRGYEHEGGQCKYCGINEVYWAHAKRA